MPIIAGRRARASSSTTGLTSPGRSARTACMSPGRRLLCRARKAAGGRTPSSASPVTTAATSPWSWPGADYVAFGAIYRPPPGREDQRAAGFDRVVGGALRNALRGAIGGITVEKRRAGDHRRGPIFLAVSARVWAQRTGRAPPWRQFNLCCWAHGGARRPAAGAAAGRDQRGQRRRSQRRRNARRQAEASRRCRRRLHARPDVSRAASAGQRTRPKARVWLKRLGCQPCAGRRAARPDTDGRRWRDGPHRRAAAAAVRGLGRRPGWRSTISACSSRRRLRTGGGPPQNARRPSSGSAPPPGGRSGRHVQSGADAPQRHRHPTDPAGPIAGT